VVAEDAPWLLPALLLPLAAVSLATRGRAEAEEATVRQLRLTEQEQEVVRRLQEADRMKADLLATVTHELRSPLATVLGALQLLHSREGRLSQAERQEFIAMGLRQGERLQRLIEQLLLAAKFEQQEPGMVMRDRERVEFDASELVRQVGAEAMARHLGRPIAVETNGPLPVRAAQEAVVQVLGNLIDNADKYSPEGHPIRLLGLRHGDDAVLAVEDTGAGIAPADRQRIFDRFAQLDRHSNQRDGGVGLGLYIARQLARSQDGKLLVTDPGNGGGTRFELRLPLTGQPPGPAG
jgi:signal transduction histidine kinase